MGSMRTVVVTGSTRGIGRGLAEAFLAAGCRVVVSGRGEAETRAAVAALGSIHGVERVAGRACDVQRLPDVEALWQEAVAKFGRVDIWINNAGITNDLLPLWDIAPADLAAVISTNVLGTLHGCRVAMRGLRAQGGPGAIYNLEGLGSDGRIIDRLGLYGSSKRCITYLTDALAREAKGSGIIVGGLMPGMVMTDLILGRYTGRPEELAKMRRLFNIIADRVQNVAPWLAARVLANRRNGAHLSYVSGAKMLWRFVSAPIFPRHVVP